MIIQGGGIATEHTLRAAPEGSIYNRLFEKNYGTEEQVKRIPVAISQIY